MHALDLMVHIFPPRRRKVRKGVAQHLATSKPETAVAKLKDTGFFRTRLAAEREGNIYMINFLD